MSRYTGPRIRKVRALGAALPGLTAKPADRRTQRPGQHGDARRRRRSDYALRLAEKQKLRFNYGLTESQLRRVVEEAKRSKVVTDQQIISLLERRVDNVVFRAGFAPTIPSARQLVNHGHFLLNGRKHNIPSARVMPGDVLSVRSRSAKHPVLQENIELPSRYLPDWLDVKTKEQEIRVKGDPGYDTPLVVDVQLVIEYYARA